MKGWFKAMTNFENIKNRDDAAIVHSYARFPLAIEKGKNATALILTKKNILTLQAVSV